VFDFAVITPTVLRADLVRACHSVVEQTVDGSINLVIGVDIALGDPTVLDAVRALATPRRTVTILDPGYSTVRDRQGVFPSRSGGGLRSALSFLGNARYLAYLDDDNWFASDHLETLGKAIAGKVWAFSLRWFADSRTGQPLAVDQFESIGPGRGIHQQEFAGFCDSSTLLLDAEATQAVLPHWCYGTAAEGNGADRRIFQALSAMPYGETGQPTAYRRLRHTDVNHAARLRWLEGAGAKPSWPMPFADAARLIREALSSDQAHHSGFAPPSLTPDGEAALAKLLGEVNVSSAIIAGIPDPAVARLVNEAASARQNEAHIVDADALDVEALALCRLLREHEVLADFSYLGAAVANDVPALLAALWAVTKRMGWLVLSGYDVARTPDVMAAIDRFAFERAAPITWLGGAHSAHVGLRRY
jgi:hypothetical protein